ncbi:response regulator transcription factor [Microcella sp.]|uniref:response regulator n=1 Tax=Microcella sp. TaxID=1913979 RepID=UPI00299F532A|nr:response regulator transcription factor [Microcella sp.]MDX2025392.1 response regulator transcription factor [Microcella sp.]
MSARRPAPVVRVVIADDAPLQRSGWRMILDSQPDIDVVGEAGDGARALAIVRREPTDVVILDLHMPRVNGLAASARISTDAAVRELGPAPRIVLATALDLDDHVAEAARAGVFAVVYKDVEPEALLEVVRAAAAATVSDDEPRR